MTDAADTAPKRPRTCPICRKPASEMHAPFCSKACKDRDLLKWLDDGYSVPGEPARIPTDEFD